jgi:hypothetical protein
LYDLILEVAAYVELMTDRYPPFRLDSGGPDPGSLPAAPPPPSPAGAPAAPGGPPAPSTAATPGCDRLHCGHPRVAVAGRLSRDSSTASGRPARGLVGSDRGGHTPAHAVHGVVAAVARRSAQPQLPT